MSTKVFNVAATNTYPIDTYVALPEANFQLVDTSVSSDGLTRESLYQYIGGSVEENATLRVGVYFNKKANSGRGSCNVSIKLTENLRSVDDNDVITDDPVTFTLAWSIPGLVPVPTTTGGSDWAAQLLMLVSTVVPTDNDGDLKAGRLSMLGRGLTDLLSAFVNGEA